MRQPAFKVRLWFIRSRSEETIVMIWYRPVLCSGKGNRLFSCTFVTTINWQHSWKNADPECSKVVKLSQTTKDNDKSTSVEVLLQPSAFCHFTGHFNGPGRAVGRVCVSACVYLSMGQKRTIVDLW